MTQVIVRILTCLVLICVCPIRAWKWNWSEPNWNWNHSGDTNSNEECQPASQSSQSESVNLSKEYRKCVKQFDRAKNKKHPLIGKDTPEIIAFYGYSCEIHQVTTKDGYIITLHRIPSNGTSVLLWHGMGSCSHSWISNGPTQSLGTPSEIISSFILAGLGYDVWLGNSRGSIYSLGHKTLSSDVLEYWDFSWHENGMFDLPASIKHIRRKNGKTPIFYVGHSQGTTNLMVGASTKPASNIVNKDNILAAFLLAPAGFAGRFYNPARVAMQLLADPTTGRLVWTALRGRLASKKQVEEFSGIYLGNVCTPKAILCGGCSTLFLAESGFNSKLMNYSNIPHRMDKTLSSNLPLKSLLHYAQSIKSCKFRQYDYGTMKNWDRYGSDVPPDYDLKSINIPTYIYWGQNDALCNPEDVKRTKEAFRKKIVKKFVRVDFDSFNHGDFVTAIKVKELLYDQIVEEMRKLKPT